MRRWEPFVVIVAVVGATLVWNAYRALQPTADSVSFTEFMRDVDSGRVVTISIDGNQVVGVNTRTGLFRTYTPRQYVGLVNRLIDRDVDVSVAPQGLWSNSAFWIVAFMAIQTGMMALLGDYVRRAARISSTA
jgi:cell division protease FtsH